MEMVKSSTLLAVAGLGAFAVLGYIALKPLGEGLAGLTKGIQDTGAAIGGAVSYPFTMPASNIQIPAAVTAATGAGLTAGTKGLGEAFGYVAQNFSNFAQQAAAQNKNPILEQALINSQRMAVGSLPLPSQIATQAAAIATGANPVQILQSAVNQVSAVTKTTAPAITQVATNLGTGFVGAGNIIYTSQSAASRSFTPSPSTPSYSYATGGVVRR